MKPFKILLLLVAVLVAALTYLLVGGAAPDSARHERTLNALRTVTLHSAALQRDVLRVREGLLRSYDPLVSSIANLRKATADLTIASKVASGEERAAIDRKIEELALAVRDQEALVEVFKSDNALLQNSLSYFNYTIGRARAFGGSPQEIEIQASAAAMLRFVTDPRSSAAADVHILLDRLSRMPANWEPASDVRVLIAHGRLIAGTLPKVDDLVSRLQTPSVSERARDLQEAYLDTHMRAAAHADMFRELLYIAALVLVAYIGYLFIRLRLNAQVLRERLEFEALLASISTQFINLPRDRVSDEIGTGLKKLTKHLGVDGGQIIVDRGGKTDLAGSYAYSNHEVNPAAYHFEKTIELALNWQLAGYQRQGSIYVRNVRNLPDGRERSVLQSRGILSWLCIPIWYAGARAGFLALDTVKHEKHWRDGDIARLRIAAEIFANAIARERNESERDELRARLSQSQRLEAIGTLAGGIAHEFNNILGAIMGYGEMARAALRESSAEGRYVEQIIKAGERAQDVVDQILAFGRRRKRELTPVRVEPIVADATELVRASFPLISIRKRLRAGDASIMGEATELHQVVMNLGTNAAQAMDGNGVLDIRLDCFETDAALRLSHGCLSAGRYVRLVVRDTGRGMDQATIERMFEPFFTTKPVGQGTGLGLSTVHGIVTEHGGAMDVRSRPGDGTTFRVYFPRTEDIECKENVNSKAGMRRGHGETVLIVDDDKPLVLLGEEMLAALGYEPIGFDRSPAALAAFRSDPNRFDLVLTDEVMPELTGTELAGALHQVRPDLPIVLMTGNDRPLQAERLRSAGIREVLRKPLLAGAMADSLARQL